jgi:hypothetical protein
MEILLAFLSGIQEQRQNPIWGSHGHPGASSEQGNSASGHTSTFILREDVQESELLTKQDSYFYRVCLLILSALCGRKSRQLTGMRHSRAKPEMKSIREIGQAETATGNSLILHLSGTYCVPNTAPFFGL